MNKRKSASNKQRYRRPLRSLSKLEEAYLAELKEYDAVLNATMLISRNQHGIDTTGRGVRAVKIFTRQTLVGMSLRNILPYPTKDQHHEESTWDICSIASLSRNILEGYLSVLYFGTEIISEPEAELRFFIAQLHRNQEWYNIRKQSDPHDHKLQQFEDGNKKQKERIKNHPYLSNLTAAQKNKALQGHEMYKTKNDFETEYQMCLDLKRDYQLLSNLVHPLPLSIERIDNESGRGIGSDADVNYCILSLIIAKRYLAATTIEISDHFHDNLASKFKDVLDPIRPLLSRAS